MRLFVTGLSGFVGTWLTRVLEERRLPPPIELLAAPSLEIRDRQAVRGAVRDARPDAVLHLAAQSNVPQAIADPAATAEVNVIGTLNLLDALEAAGFKGRLLFVGSGDEYGLVEESSLPLREEAPLAPRNPYAASKAAAEMFVLERARRGRIDALCARPFNHTGPGQDARFVLPALARQVAAIAAGRRPAKIVAGDLDVTRDFLDVRDVVAAYLLLLDQGEAGGVYNVCSGAETHLRRALEQMLALAGVSAEVSRDPALLRPAEQRRHYGDNSRLRALGWTPAMSLAGTLADLIDYWTSENKREQIA